MRDSRIFSLAFIIVGLSLWTLAPYGGCSCNNPLGPNSGPTPTPTPVHGPMVDDFNDATAGYFNPVRLDHWKGGCLLSVDAHGTSSASATGYSSGGADGGNCFHFVGLYGQTMTASAYTTGNPASNICSTPGYPFMAFRLNLNPGAPGTDENVSNAGGLTGVEFYAKLGPTDAGNGITLKGILLALSNYATASSSTCEANAFHYHTANVAAGALNSSTWTLIKLPYSSFAWGGSWGADSIGGTYATTTLNSAVCRNGDGSLSLMALQFEPTNPSGNPPAQANFDFYIDDVEFY